MKKKMAEEKQIFNLSQIDKEKLFSVVYDTTKKQKKLEISYISKEGKRDDGKKFYLTDEHIKNAKIILNAVWNLDGLTKEDKKELIKIAKLEDADVYKSLEYVKATCEYFKKNSKEFIGKDVELFDDVVTNKQIDVDSFAGVVETTAFNLMQVMRKPHVQVMNMDD